MKTGTLSGHRVYLNPLMTKEQREWVPRSWKERLFTLPWCPMKATKLVIRRVPDGDAFRLPTGDLVMHPETYAHMKEMIKNGL